MKETKVAGVAAFLKTLDPDFVQRDLVDGRLVRAPMARYLAAGGAVALAREELVSI
jgi:NitT/TauT family transport system substrate-binding protein